jgi:hypothetical protein
LSPVPHGGLVHPEGDAYGAAGPTIEGKQYRPRPVSLAALA